MLRALLSKGVLAGLLLVQVSQPIPVNGDKPLDVCTVLKNIQTYRGEIISIRGRWDGDDIQGDCGITSREDNRFGIPYSENAIVWVHPYGTNWDDQPEWSEDRVVVEALTKKYDQLMRQGHNVLATFVGRLEARRTDFRSGYGHMGAYRAQLVLVTIKDVVSETGKPVRTPPKLSNVDR